MDGELTLEQFLQYFQVSFVFLLFTLFVDRWFGRASDVINRPYTAGLVLE